MKPLLSQKVQRGVVLNEYEPAEHQSTMDGLNAFAERQRKRMVDAQRAATETSRKVRTIKS